jgi:hypothetical protein
MNTVRNEIPRDLLNPHEKHANHSKINNLHFPAC